MNCFFRNLILRNLILFVSLITCSCFINENVSGSSINIEGCKLDLNKMNFGYDFQSKNLIYLDGDISKDNLLVKNVLIKQNNNINNLELDYFYNGIEKSKTYIISNETYNELKDNAILLEPSNNIFFKKANNSLDDLLKEMTSTDKYIDNFLRIFYDTGEISFDSLFDIIPKQIFRLEENFSYIGLEYGFFVKTNNDKSVQEKNVLKNILLFNIEHNYPYCSGSEYRLLLRLQDFIGFNLIYTQNSDSNDEAFHFSNMNYSLRLSNVVMSASMENVNELNKFDDNYKAIEDNGDFMCSATLNFSGRTTSIDDLTLLGESLKTTLFYTVGDKSLETLFGPFGTIVSYFANSIEEYNEESEKFEEKRKITADNSENRYTFGMTPADQLKKYGGYIKSFTASPKYKGDSKGILFYHPFNDYIELKIELSRMDSFSDTSYLTRLLYGLQFDIYDFDENIVLDTISKDFDYIYYQREAEIIEIKENHFKKTINLNPNEIMFFRFKQEKSSNYCRIVLNQKNINFNLISVSYDDDMKCITNENILEALSGFNNPTYEVYLSGLLDRIFEVNGAEIKYDAYYLAAFKNLNTVEKQLTINVEPVINEEITTMGTTYNIPIDTSLESNLPVGYNFKLLFKNSGNIHIDILLEKYELTYTAYDYSEFQLFNSLSNEEIIDSDVFSNRSITIDLMPYKSKTLLGYINSVYKSYVKGNLSFTATMKEPSFIVNPMYNAIGD